jgi:hypothetical protein
MRNEIPLDALQLTDQATRRGKLQAKGQREKGTKNDSKQARYYKEEKKEEDDGLNDRIRH